MKSASVTGQDNQHQVNTSAEDDHLPEETVATDEDHIPALLMVTGAEENTQVTEKESTETETETGSIRKEEEIVQDLGRRSTEREDRADQTHQENE